MSPEPVDPEALHYTIRIGDQAVINIYLKRGKGNTKARVNPKMFGQEVVKGWRISTVKFITSCSSILCIFAISIEVKNTFLLSVT